MELKYFSKNEVACPESYYLPLIKFCYNKKSIIEHAGFRRNLLLKTKLKTKRNLKDGETD
jgi:hypothetical protein